MKEIKLGDFIVLADGRRYCIINQKIIDGIHFSYALTVPDKTEEMANAKYKLLKSSFVENGKIGTREYTETEKDYQKVKKLLTR